MIDSTNMTFIQNFTGEQVGELLPGTLLWISLQFGINPICTLANIV